MLLKLLKGTVANDVRLSLLSFVASIATHFVTRFDGAVELLRQTFPVACYAWSTFCRAAVATLAVHRKAHAWVTHAPSFLITRSTGT